MVGRSTLAAAGEPVPSPGRQHCSGPLPILAARELEYNTDLLAPDCRQWSVCAREGYFGGRLFSASLEARVAPVPQLMLTGTYTYNRLRDVGTGDDDIRAGIPGWRLALALNARFQVDYLLPVQYPLEPSCIEQPAAMGEYLPMSFLYIVLNDTRGGCGRPAGRAAPLPRPAGHHENYVASAVVGGRVGCLSVRRSHPPETRQPRQRQCCCSQRCDCNIPSLTDPGNDISVAKFRLRITTPHCTHYWMYSSCESSTHPKKQRRAVPLPAQPFEPTGIGFFTARQWRLPTWLPWPDCRETFCMPSTSRSQTAREIPPRVRPCAPSAAASWARIMVRAIDIQLPVTLQLIYIGTGLGETGRPDKHELPLSVEFVHLDRPRRINFILGEEIAGFQLKNIQVPGQFQS